MFGLLTRVLRALLSVLAARGSREAEILVLRQQLLVLSRKAPKRARLRNIDRLILVWLSRLFLVWRITDFPRISNSPHTGSLWAPEGCPIVGVGPHQ
jgi:hypothetical protein